MSRLTAIVLSSGVLLGAVLSAVGAAEPSGPEGSPKDAAAEKAKSPAASKPAAKKSGRSLDDDLFGDLTGELFEGLEQPKLDKGAKAAEKSNKPVESGKSPKEEPVPDEFAAGEDLGQESNPLLDLGQRMRRAESLISKGTTGDPTQRLQNDIVKDLDKLIELTKKSCPICNSCNSPGQKNQSNLAKSGQPKNGKGSGDFRPNPRPKGSDEGVRKDKVREAKTGGMLASEKEVWGILPERVQEAIRNAQSSKFISEYSTEVKDYFTRLAEMYQEQLERQ
jgi:hypothetical protein